MLIDNQNSSWSWTLFVRKLIMTNSLFDAAFLFFDVTKHLTIKISMGIRIRGLAHTECCFVVIGHFAPVSSHHSLCKRYPNIRSLRWCWSSPVSCERWMPLHRNQMKKKMSCVPICWYMKWTSPSVFCWLLAQPVLEQHLFPRTRGRFCSHHTQCLTNPTMLCF